MGEIYISSSGEIFYPTQRRSLFNLQAKLCGPLGTPEVRLPPPPPLRPPTPATPWPSKPFAPQLSAWCFAIAGERQEIGGGGGVALFLCLLVCCLVSLSGLPSWLLPVCSLPLPSLPLPSPSFPFLPFPSLPFPPLPSHPFSLSWLVQFSPSESC